MNLIKDFNNNITKMINLNEKSRVPNPKNEILTQSFLIDKIANEMKIKYKKVFSLINYDEFSLKSDIHNLLSKYISNKHKEINIKYIETTILNKVRQKYKILKTPLNPINKNKKLIKIIYSSPNKINTYLNLNKKPISSKKNKKFLNPIKNYSFSNNDELNENSKNDNYYTNDVKIVNINNSEDSKVLNKDLSNEKIEGINKLNEIGIHNNELKEKILKEEEEIKNLEKYREDIQNQIKDLEKEKIKNLNELLMDSNENKEDNNNEKVNDIENNKNDVEIKNDYNWNYNPLMSFEQMKYLERRKRIEEDFYNKQNRYIFLKPRTNKKEEKENSNNENDKNIYRYDNIKINKYSEDKLNEFYKIKEKLREEKEREREKELKNRSAKNIHDYKLINEENIKPRLKKENSIPFEDKIQMKILQRSLNQEKAIEHLRNILYPQKQIKEEGEYQGFNNEKNFEKKNKYELADAARKIQIEKLKKYLDDSIEDRQKQKEEEKEIEKRYRLMYEKDYELFMEKEKQKKREKEEKIENYRKMLDEQIKAKNQKMLDDKNNILDINKELWQIDY